MAFNFLNSLINEGARPSNSDEDLQFLDVDNESDNESDIDEELVHDLEEESDNDDTTLKSNNDVELKLRSSDGGACVHEVPSWSRNLRPVTVEKFSERTGPSDGIDPQDNFTALDYFALFVSEDFYTHCVVETNRYARQKIREKPDPEWKAVNTDEIKLFFYINFMFGIHPLPDYKLYWSNNDLLNVPAVSRVMSRRRYEKISKYFHLNNNDNFLPQGEPGHDPIFKVRPLFDIVLQNSRTHMSPEREISIDEAVIAFTGRPLFKQYIKNKPASWGIRLWCAADPHSGYLFNFDVYSGKATRPLQHDLGHDVVFSMGEPYLDRHHHFYFSHFFSSVKLASHLLERSTYSCATIWPSRKGWPQDLKNLKIMKSGEETGIRMRQDGNLVACYFNDKRPVHVISTNANPTLTETPCSTSDGCGKVVIPMPIKVLSSGIRGVDLHHQLRSYYPIGRRSRKWWRCLLWFLLQVAAVNSYIIFKKIHCQRHPTRKPKSHLEFRIELLEKLVNGRTCRKRTANEAPLTVGINNGDHSAHQPTRLAGRKKACQECLRQKRRTPSNRAVETTNGCPVCKVHLCTGHCFAAFHVALTSQP